MKKMIFKLPKQETVSKHKFFWQSQADEVSEYFGAKLFWLFHKFYPEEIMSQYKFMKETGDKDTQTLISHLQWMKKNGQGKIAETDA